MSDSLTPESLPIPDRAPDRAPVHAAPAETAPAPSPADGKGGRARGNSNHGNGGNGSNGVAANGAGSVRPTDIIEEMQVAYLDYAMSVIVARALPDVRDGLKPVHRRILYAIWHDLGLTHDKPHKKSARIVGEVLGKYHPHGDSAVYDAMVRMAQPFSLRYPLIDGQGNFGSVDGDNAAAMRYTEARLAAISDLMLDDLDKDTVDWHPNFDNTLREPDILPAALPNLLINGSSGIAVGMATNIPPHNLGEVVDALAFMIDHYADIDEVTVDRLLQFIKGPDFPTGGVVYRFRDEGKSAANSNGADENGRIDVIAQGYSTGKARLIMQAKAHFEEMSRGRMRIIVTELPYQTNKTTLLERIADLVRDGKLEGISDLRDESDRTGMRVVLELKREIDPKSVLADLYKYTPLQQTFGMQLLALVDGQPRLLNLKRMLQYFIQHRQEIIRRRSEFDLARARERLHIVEGLLRALDILDEVIATIRRSQTAETARKNLIANFKFTEVQAQAILEMQLRRLAALERKKLQEEHDELRKKIAWLEDLLNSPRKVLDLIKSDLLAIKEKYADPRRTQIVDLTKGAHTTHDLLPEIEVWVSASADGTLRRQTVGRQSAAVMRQLGRGADATLFQANTRNLLYLFTSGGRAARIGIHEITEEGKQFSDLALFSRNERLVAALPLSRNVGPSPEGYVFLATEKGIVKRILLADLVSSVIGGTLVMKVEEKDRLGWAMQTNGNQEIMLVTSGGQAIRFNEDEVRSMGLAATGVGGIKLDKNEKVIHAGVVDPRGVLATFTSAGFAKLSALGEYPVQGRNGGGVVAHKVGPRTGDLTAATLLPAVRVPRWLLLMAGKSASRVMETDEIPRVARAAQGKQVVEAGGAPVISLRFVPGPESSDASAPAEPRLLDDPPSADLPPAPLAPKPAEAPKQPPATKSTKPGASSAGASGFVPVKTPPKEAPSAPEPAKGVQGPPDRHPQGSGEGTSVQPGLFGEPEPSPPPAKPSKLQAVTSLKNAPKSSAKT